MLKRMARMTLVLAVWALVLAGGQPGRSAEPGEKPEFEIAPEEADDVLRADMEQAEAGDNREFTVVTDDNVAGIEKGDIYKNRKAYYKVAAISYKGDRGGKFTVQRFKGTDDPSKTWNRVSGSGPLTIVGRETLLDRFLSGGALMYPIAFLLLCTIVIALNSLRIYRRGKQIPRAFFEASRKAIAAGDVDRFEDLALHERGLLGQVCRAMVLDFRASTPAEIRRRCEAQGSKQVDLLRTPLRTLNFIAAVAPLLGLLGTVIGIIICFEALEGEAATLSRAQALAKGIKVALLTTAFGLCVAVPALLVYFIFNTRLNLIATECGAKAEELIHELVLLKRSAGHPGAAEPRPAGRGAEAPVEEADR